MSRNRSKSSLARGFVFGTVIAGIIFALFQSSDEAFVGQLLPRIRVATSSAALGDVDPIRTISADVFDIQEQERLVQSIRIDLESACKDDGGGFTFTPLASDLQFVDSFVHTKGRLPVDMYLAPQMAAIKRMAVPYSLKFEVKSIEVVDADFNPWGNATYPPRTDAPVAKRPAKYAIYATWETSCQGRFNITGPNGGNLFEQKPFYMSGQDVFRVDERGQVSRLEMAIDQHPLAIAAHFSPFAQTFVPTLISKKEAGASVNLDAATVLDQKVRDASGTQKTIAELVGNNSAPAPVIFLRHMGSPDCWAHARAWTEPAILNRSNELGFAEPIFVSPGKPHQIAIFLKENPSIPTDRFFVDDSDTYEVFRNLKFGRMDTSFDMNGAFESMGNFRPPSLDFENLGKYASNFFSLTQLMANVPLDVVILLGGTVVLGGDKVLFSSADRVPGDYPKPEVVIKSLQEV